MTPTGLKGRKSQPRGSGFEASERWGERKSALQRLLFLLPLLEHAFALSIGLLSSRTVGEAANLTGSSCCKFWEMLKKLSLLQKDTWAAAEVTEPPANGGYSVLCWKNSFEGRREPETKSFVSACSLCSFRQVVWSLSHSCLAVLNWFLHICQYFSLEKYWCSNQKTTTGHHNHPLQQNTKQDFNLALPKIEASSQKPLKELVFTSVFSLL